MSGSRAPAERFALAVFGAGVLWALLMVVVVVIVCWGQWPDVGLSFAVLFASSTVGAGVGFAFGIPRWVSMSTPPEAVGMTEQGRVIANSNFSKVSDWLTTIVVGLGIAQFGKVLDGLGWLGRTLADVYTLPSISPTARSTYGLCQVLAGVLLGFILMFMWTSTRYLQVAAGE